MCVRVPAKYHCRYPSGCQVSDRETRWVWKTCNVPLEQRRGPDKEGQIRCRIWGQGEVPVFANRNTDDARCLAHSDIRLAQTPKEKLAVIKREGNKPESIRGSSSSPSSPTLEPRARDSAPSGRQTSTQRSSSDDRSHPYKRPRGAASANQPTKSSQDLCGKDSYQDPPIRPLGQQWSFDAATSYLAPPAEMIFSSGENQAVSNKRARKRRKPQRSLPLHFVQVHKAPTRRLLPKPPQGHSAVSPASSSAYHEHHNPSLLSDNFQEKFTISGGANFTPPQSESSTAKGFQTATGKPKPKEGARKFSAANTTFTPAQSSTLTTDTRGFSFTQSKPRVQQTPPPSTVNQPPGIASTSLVVPDASLISIENARTPDSRATRRSARVKSAASTNGLGKVAGSHIAKSINNKVVPASKARKTLPVKPKAKNRGKKK